MDWSSGSRAILSSDRTKTMSVYVGRRTWRWDASQLPWFDRPDSSQRLQARRKAERLGDEEFELLRHWVADGYAVASGVVPESDIDAMERDLDDVWSADRPHAGLDLLGVRLDANGAVANLTHAQLLGIGMPERLEVRHRSNWRIHGFHRFSAAAAAVFNNTVVTRLASLILGTPAAPSYTINFTHGSEQGLHQDTAVFHVAPPNFLVGAWLACEDISPDAGPLIVYPGSHRTPMFSEFDDYPQTNLRTSPSPGRYDDFMREISRRYEPKTFLARKGEVLLWHGMLIHGGSPVVDRTRSRRSHVCHYIPPGMNVAEKIEGPFNW